jgi:N-acetylglutamate synthase-like GNAT family acetyltransferase
MPIPKRPEMPRQLPMRNEPVIRPCQQREFREISTIINDAAQTYKGVIPEDCWADPYMSDEELRHEMDAGVTFWGYEKDGALVGVMGIQRVQDVALIRHAYVRTACRRLGIGGQLLSQLRSQASQPILIGTWAAAAWATRFYERHGFRQVSAEEKDRLLKKYWSVPERQIEVSVVLADPKWFDGNPYLTTPSSGLEAVA